MKEGEEENETIIEEVKKINNQFYHAFENLSIEMMERLWKHVDNAVCIHPGWDLFIGWLAIRESWITIFRNTEMIRFTITNTKVRVFGGNNIAVVVCLKNIEIHSIDKNNQLLRLALLLLTYLSTIKTNGYLSIKSWFVCIKLHST